jgi:hypothetical protein
VACLSLWGVLVQLSNVAKGLCDHQLTVFFFIGIALVFGVMRIPVSILSARRLGLHTGIEGLVVVIVRFMLKWQIHKIIHWLFKKD